MTTLSTRTDEILALAAAATPGPWFRNPVGTGFGAAVLCETAMHHFHPSDKYRICTVPIHGNLEANAAFIARAHEMALLIRDYRDALAAAENDARRYRWLRDLKCCTFTISRDDGHAINYTTLKEWSESYCPEQYSDVPADELQRMKDTNTDWCLHVYPDTPIGFWEIHAATIDAAIDTAIASEQAGGKV